MSEATVPPVDPKRRTKQFTKQLSMSFQKGKEAMKRGLLTPRGARAQQKPAAEVPVPEPHAAVPDVPKVPASFPKPVSNVLPSKVVEDPAEVPIKATVEAKDSTAAHVVLEPVESAVSQELTGPATPAPFVKAVSKADEPVEPLHPEKAPSAPLETEKTAPEALQDEGSLEEELGSAPPNVRVIVTGTPADDAKAVVALDAKPSTGPVNGKSGGVKKALVGILVLAAASAVSLALRGAQAH